MEPHIWIAAMFEEISLPQVCLAVSCEGMVVSTTVCVSDGWK